MIMDVEWQLVVGPLGDATATSAWFCPGDALVFPEAPMPRYFFHVHDGGGLVPDDLGLDLPDIDAARTAAIELNREILRSDVVGPFQDYPSWRIEVSDSPEPTSLPLFVLHFSVEQ
jgi:hypothetical protein